MLARRHTWLVRGAFASALTYSSVAVIHTIVLEVASKHSIYDIDTVGAWAVVSVGCVLISPILQWSLTLSKEQIRPVLGVWGTLVSAGSVLAPVSLFFRDYPSEPVCRFQNGELLSKVSQLGNQGLNCTYSCFRNTQIMRIPSDISVVTKKQIFGSNFNLLISSAVLTWFFGALLGLYSCVRMPRKRTEAELHAIVKQSRIETSPSFMNGYQQAQDASSRQEARISAQRELDTGKLHREPSVLGIVNPLAIVVVIVLNEVYLLINGGLPSNENPHSVGQWGPWTGVALAIVAAAIVRYNQPEFLKRQEILAQDKVAFELRKRQQREAANQASGEAQMSVPTITSNTPNESSDPGSTTVTKATTQSQKDLQKDVDLEAARGGGRRLTL